MYVCICNAVTLKTVRDTIAQGASTVDEVERRCRAGGDCGSCRDEITSLLDEHHGCRRAVRPAAVSVPAFAVAS